MESFDTFLDRRIAAAHSYVNGDSGPLSEVLTRSDPATFLSPRGDAVQGADAIASRYQQDAGLFEDGSTNRIEILQSNAGDKVGFWTGYQIAEARLKGAPEPIPMKLRVTEAFRLEDGEWKLVHRHAEQVKEPGGGSP